MLRENEVKVKKSQLSSKFPSMKKDKTTILREEKA